MGEVWFAPDDPSLPMPWKGIVDGNTGCLFYWNPETNITQHEKPAYWVSSPSLSPGLFYPPHPAVSDYNLHSQYPNLYPHYQAPVATVINGYTFPTQFPFPNHTHTPPNQPISPQSQSTDYHDHSLTHPPITHPSYHLPPFVTSTYPSESDYGCLSSLSYLSDQPFSCDPYSTSPDNSSYSPITYPHTEPKESIVHPYQLPYTADIIPPSAVVYIADGTSCIEKDDVPPPKMKKSLRHNLKMRPHVMMKRKPRSQFPRRRRTQNNGGSEGNLCKALLAVNWVSTVMSNKPLDLDFELTNLDFVVKNGSISTSSKVVPMFFPGDDAAAVYEQLLGFDELYHTERAKDILLLEGFRQILGKKGGPLVDRQLLSIDMELARSYLNLHLEMPLTDSGNIPDANVQGAILNHFYQVTNLISSLKPNLLSTRFVESPLILEVSILESYELGSKHEAVEFDKLMGYSFTVIKLIKTLDVTHLAHLRDTLPNWQVRVQTVLSSNKGGFDYDMNLENLIESLTSGSQKLFVNKHGKGIQNKCSVMYHWLPSSLNWNKKCIRDAFLSLELFVSSVTSKSLLSESCRGGGMSMGKAMEETLLENTVLQIVIASNCTNLKHLSYPMQLVEELDTETVSRTLSIVVDLQLFKAIIVHVLQLGLSFWVVVLHFIAVLKELAVIGINLNGLITVSVENFSNKMFLICCLLTTAEGRTFFGRFRSLKKNKLDGRLNLHVQFISRMQLWHMGISCIIDTNGKQLENSPFCEQLKKQYGFFCFVILAEGYLMTFLLYFEDHIFQIWSNMRSKIGACTIIELPQCMNKMQIFPLDSTSWMLVVFKYVKAVLQINIFYYYVQRVVTLGIIHFGCGFFPFLYECVDHSSTIVENPTIIIRGAKAGNLLHWKMATSTLGHLKLHGYLGFDDEEAAHNALECLTDLLPHDTEVYFRYFLGIPEIYVAWKKTKFLLVFHINLSNPMLDEDLEYIMKTLVSPNATALRSTTGNVILIFHGSHCQAFSMSLLEMAPNPFYTATVAAKVRPDEPTLLKVPFAIFGVANIALEHHNPSLEQADALLNSNSMVILLRRCSCAHLTMANSTVVFELVFNFPAHAPYYNSPGMINLSKATSTHNWGYSLNWEIMPHATWDFIFMITAYFVVQRRVTFGGIHTANSLEIWQTGQEEYNVQSYMKTINAHKLLILNPSDVVVKMGLRTLSTYFKLIFASVMAKKNIVDIAYMIEEVRGKVTVHDAIPLIILTTGSCGYWNAKKAKAKSLHAIMWGAWIQSTENLINEGHSNVVVHTKATWLQLEGIWFNFSLPQF